MVAVVLVVAVALVAPVVLVVAVVLVVVVLAVVPVVQSESPPPPVTNSTQGTPEHLPRLIDSLRIYTHITGRG